MYKILILCALVGSSLGGAGKEAPNGGMNMRPGLLPPEGTIWRGATIDNAADGGIFEGSWNGGTDPYQFEDYYGQPLHIYRNFNQQDNAELTTEFEFIQNGGIVFYSIQPEDWAAMGAPSKSWEIRKYARAVASAAPSQMLVVVGYEPDLYIPEVNGKDSEKNSGTIADYHKMWEHFATIFEEEGADNAVFALDFSWDIRNDPTLVDKLWPRNVNIQWLFWNMFQFQKIIDRKVGDCDWGFDEIYNHFDRTPGPWTDLPWGLGAWGVAETEWDAPEEDKISCILGTRDKIASGDYPKIKASIYFNSLNCRIDHEKQSHMLDTFNEFMGSDFFYDDKHFYEE